MQFESIGERIAEGRRALGISQEELGERVGVSRQTVSRWEVGEAKPSVEAVMALCLVQAKPATPKNIKSPATSSSDNTMSVKPKIFSHFVIFRFSVDEYSSSLRRAGRGHLKLFSPNYGDSLDCLCVLWYTFYSMVCGGMSWLCPIKSYGNC